jgi:uncharacterized protein (DUF342 family)
MAARRQGRRETERTGVAVSEHIWETFDSLFKTVHRQGRRVEELEARIVSLERILNERESSPAAAEQKQAERLAEVPVERAA